MTWAGASVALGLLTLAYTVSPWLAGVVVVVSIAWVLRRQ